MPFLDGVPDFTKELTIIINEEQPELTAKSTVPEGLLEKSDFFKAACRNEWKEATSRVIKLPDVDGDAFRAYLYWTYRKEVAIDMQMGSNSDIHAEDGHEAILELARLWLLGDRLADASLRNAVVDKILVILSYISEHAGECSSSIIAAALGVDVTALIWSGTTTGRALRRVVLDSYTWWVYPEDLKPLVDSLHHDFVKELMLHGLQPNSLNENPTARDWCCAYHEHDDQHLVCEEKPQAELLKKSWEA